MTDEELTLAMAELQEVVRCRCDEAYRDRGLKDPQCECDSAEAVKVVANRIKDLEAKLATCEKYRDAYAEMDRIGTHAVRDIEAKLAKAVELLEAWGDVAVHCSIEEGVCCCGDNMENHTNPMDCGHTPLDHGTYIAIQLAEKTRATLAEIKGESHD